MLVLSRKQQQSIVINDNIVVTVLSVDGSNVRLGFEAPREIQVHRWEVHEAMKHRKAPSNAGSENKALATTQRKEAPR